ncbi:LysM peptidoglycan-binding domain-containing protein [Cytobacillus sp. FJAT-54145]|uniref:LysM peptidoglycan-binding domain-containing protein n=1 Tax=Cytobacillus spartinae TaxID=3299023 RepID=A0ABW6K8D3_9BACI
MKKLWNQYSYTIILVILSFTVTFVLLGNEKKELKDEFVEITVEEGDSLWSISKEFSSYHELSPGEFINWVKQNNQLSGSHLYVGEKIMIPVLTEELQFSKQIASSYNEQLD